MIIGEGSFFSMREKVCWNSTEQKKRPPEPQLQEGTIKNERRF
jgi:hypothetical protein